MRILCIHGAAQNGKVFESRTAQLRSLLPQTYSYDWLDGPYQVVPAKLLSDAYPGPYLSHVETVTTDGIHSAISTLKCIIEEDGPYDGVMGFSEGAMLAASLLFKHQIEKPTWPLPFRFAIFISALPPFSWTNSVGQDVFTLLMGHSPLSVDPTAWKGQTTSESIKRPDRARLDAEGLRDLTPDLLRCEGLASDPDAAHLRPHCLHPAIHPDRLALPTVHIWGQEDLLSGHSELLLGLCDPDSAESYQHSGGHDVPQSGSDSEALSDLIQKTILRSEFCL